MAKYNVVKYCRLCKKRFVVPSGSAKSFYCKECEEKVRKRYEKEAAEERAAEEKAEREAKEAAAKKN